MSTRRTPPKLSQGQLRSIARTSNVQVNEAKLSAEIAVLSSQIETSRVTLPGGPARRLWLGILVILTFSLLILGALLEITQTGSRFIFLHAAAYSRIGLWTGVALMLPIAMMLKAAERKQPYMHYRYPTRWVRALMWCLTVVVAAGLCVIAPLGWIALAARVAGTPVERVEGRIVQINETSASARGCKQHATISYSGTSSRLCIDDRGSIAGLKAGNRIWLSGQAVRWGLFVNRIEPTTE